MTRLTPSVIEIIGSLGPGSALWLDAAGTLLHPREPVSQTYAQIAADHGVRVEPSEVAARFPVAMREHRQLRLAEPDWRNYWRAVVADATGSNEASIFQQLYLRFSQPDAWTLASGCCAFIDSAAARGVKVALISNWDDRLRPLLQELGLLKRFDTAIISGEEGVEKPDPRIFELAVNRLEIAAENAVMIGDSPSSDVAGAAAVGAAVIQIGRDFKSFDELTAQLV